MSRPTLFELLPAIMRQRDSELAQQLGQANGEGPLFELLTIIDEQVAMMEADMGRLYDDQFIESCAEWAVAYLGELIGIEPSAIALPATLSRRALVANTIAYRRRKGTAAMLEQVARDATGWPTRAVELFQQVALSQPLNHLQPANRTVDLRDNGALQALGTPFNRLAHTAEMGTIGSGRGRFNLPNIGLFVYRLQVDSVSHIAATPHEVEGRYFFNRLGGEQPLFNNPQTEAGIELLAERANVPAPLSRYELAAGLDHYYGPGRSLTIWLNEQLVSSEQICVASLSGEDWGVPHAKKVTVDPELGRLFVPADLRDGGELKVSYYRGLCHAVGGGEYDRSPSLVMVPGQQTRRVDETISLDELLSHDKLAGLLAIAGNESHQISQAVRVGQGDRLDIQADNQYFPQLMLPADGWRLSGEHDSELSLNGLLLSGGHLHIPKLVESAAGAVENKLQRLRLSHCTLAPGVNIIAERPLLIELDHCLANGVIMPVDGCLQLMNSALVSTGFAISGGADSFGPQTSIQNCTLIGSVKVNLLQASNTIFCDGEMGVNPAIEVRQKQQGCLSHCYVPAGSLPPRLSQCVQEEALTDRPQFVSSSLSHPAYLQLTRSTGEAIRLGADDGSEMGLYHDLYQPQREALLQEQLTGSLPFGLESGVIFVT